MKLFVKTVYITNDNGNSVYAQLTGYLRGQWVNVNGMRARIVNFVNGRAVLWMQSDNMVAVWP